MESNQPEDIPPTATPLPERAPALAAMSLLSERETEILKLVATGASNKQIAQQLAISINTVKVHVRNILAKIGVTSRTEAAWHAVRMGLVPLAGDAVRIAREEGIRSANAAGDSSAARSPAALQSAPGAAGGLGAWPVRPTLWPILVLAVLAGAAIVAYFRRPLLGANMAPAAAPLPTPLPRWEAKADMPTARSGLAVATYENQIYAIAGETTGGVSDSVERYDPASDTWTTLTSKPVAVADVSAAVIGGQIYVPGGRLVSGQVTDFLEVYDPRQSRWERRAPLPVALSGYALVAFEGRLVLFGGWDGQRYVASVYSYDPDTDAWSAHTSMPTARGFAAAAVAGGKIYVMGGTDSSRRLAVNEEYVPENETGGGSPWRERLPLPEGRSAMGAATLVDIIHIVGGAGDQGRPLPPLKYFPQRDAWEAFEDPGGQPWPGPGLAVVETQLHVMGGRQATGPAARHQAYRAIYTIELPVIR